MDWSAPLLLRGGLLDSPVEFDARRKIVISRSRRSALFLLLPAMLACAPGGSGLMMTRCSTARMAARLRSVLHDAHASRTRSDGGISLMTVADPVSRSYSRRAALISCSVRCRISSQSARSITRPE